MKKIETHIIKDREICKGKWMSLHHIDYVNKHGHKKVWECASRINSQGAAMMIATLKPSNRVIVVRQFRPPLNSKVIEFPAGLIDPGEPPVKTAVRELYEETGYQGKVVKELPASCNSPGLSGEKTITLLMEVNDADYPSPPHPALEDDEDIETFIIEKHELLDFLLKKSDSDNHIDSKLMVYAICNSKEFLS